MKKNLLFIFCCLFIITLTGCGKKEENVELPKEVYVSFEAFGEETLLVVETTEDNREKVNETGSIGWMSKEGTLISDVLTKWNVTSIEACADDELEGWMAYKMNSTTDENGFVTYNAQKVSGDTLYTTQEVLESKVPDYDITYYSKCKSKPIEYYNIQ